MAPLNYAQKMMIWFMIWSSVLVSILLISSLHLRPFTPKEAFLLGVLWLILGGLQVVLAVQLGMRLTNKMLFESRLKLRLKAIKRDMLAQAEQYQQLQEHLLEGLIIIDEENRIDSINRAAKRLFGLGNIRSRASLAEIIREPEIHEIISHARDQQQAVQRSIRVGSPVMVKLLCKATMLPKAKMSLSMVDISKLIGLDERHDDFITHASHELKTPISVILANAELLVDADHDKENALLLHAIMRQALRAKKLLESLLELLRLNAGHYPTKPEILDLAKLVSELKNGLGQMGAIINNHVPDDVTIVSDRLLLERLAMIIIENAQKYAGPQPSLSITAERQNDHVKIKFVDNGPGIKTHLRERVFEQFFRLPEHDASDKEGFGLGLSHARAIATSLGGTIFVEDTEGQGCAISLMLAGTSTMSPMS